DGGLDLLLVGDVGMDGDAFDFGCDLFRILLALVEHGDLCAFGGHGARGGGTQARATAGDENGNVFQLHFENLSLGFSFLDLFSTTASSGGGGSIVRIEHAAAEQRFH